MTLVRGYIFTDWERAVIQQFLEGSKPAGIYKIRYWFKRHETLERDIELYFKLKEKFKQS